MHLKVIVSMGAIALAIVRLFWPRIDALTVALLLLAVLPWMGNLFESLEIPGVFSIKYRDLSRASEKVTGTTSTPAPAAGERDFATRFILEAPAEDQDPNLLLVAVRIQIETRIRELAKRHGLDSKEPLSELVRKLGRRGEGRARGTLNDDTVSGLLQLIRFGNEAAHGARVEPSAVNWARDVAPKVLGELDRLIQGSSGPSQRGQDPKG